VVWRVDWTLDTVTSGSVNKGTVVYGTASSNTAMMCPMPWVGQCPECQLMCVRVQNVYYWVSDRFTISRPESFRLNKIVYTSTIQTAADQLFLWRANLNTPNLMTAAANRSNNSYLFFNPILRQAILTLCPLNLSMLQQTYRPGTAALLWRQVAGSGLSSSCTLQLALTGNEVVRGHNI
jgi:hypothetical protein